MKRSHKLVIIVLLQVFFLFGMIGFKYFTVYSGTPVLLKTAPVDPWDVFRGEYVQLNYEISGLDSDHVEDYGMEKPGSGGSTVYVVLEQGIKYWNAVSIHPGKPEPNPGQVIIKGRLVYYDEQRQEYHVTYGIESYYVPEGEGPVLERQASLDALVKVDRFGNAVLERVTKE